MGHNVIPGAKTYPNFVVPSNAELVERLTALKAEMLEMIEHFGIIRLWILLNIPRIEDGNNFGVSIQEETVNDLQSKEDLVHQGLEAISKYYLMRGKLVSKVCKYPHLGDYRQSIIELDEKEYFNYKLALIDLRNSYFLGYDLIMKNLEKIKTPRTSNHINSMF